MNRQLAVALDVTPDGVGDDLLVRRADDEFALVPILEAQQLGAVLLPATRFLPQLGRLHGRHQQFQCASLVHFFTNDVFNLAQYAQAERHPGVDAGSGALDVAGAQHHFLADDLGVCRGFLQSGEKELRSAHGMLLNLLQKKDFTRCFGFACRLSL